MKLDIFKTCVVTGFMIFCGGALPTFAAEKLQVTVPFSFTVGGAKMAAGDYAITESDNGLVTFLGTKTSAIVLSVPADYTKGNGSVINFAASQSDPVLTGIQVSGGSREIPHHNASERKIAIISAR